MEREREREREGRGLNSVILVSSCRSLTGREAAYTIHGFEVNIHPSQASGTARVPAGSNKVRSEEREREREMDAEAGEQESWEWICRGHL